MNNETNVIEKPRKEVGSKEFLGYEFLLWLFFVAKGHSVEFDIDTVKTTRETEKQIVVGKKVAMTDLGGGKFSMSGCGLENSGSLTMSLKSGFRIKSLGIDFGIGSIAYGLVIDCNGVITGLSIPKMMSDEKEDGPTVEVDGQKKKTKKISKKIPFDKILDLRLQCANEAIEFVDGLYTEFMSRRLDVKKWQEEAAVIKDAIRTHVELKAKPVPIDEEVDEED